MFGGAATMGPQLQLIAAAFANGNPDEARRLDADMKRMLFGIYGGEQITCWLTGLKYYLVRRGIFSSASYLGYPLTDTCRAFIVEIASRAAVIDSPRIGQ